jgi:hypothetical protein
MLLAATPARVVDALQGTSPEALAEVDALRETLGCLGHALPP